MEDKLFCENCVSSTEWDKFIHKSENKNIFSLSDFLNSKKYKVKKVFIKKNKEIVASFALFSKNNKVFQGDRIYTPINFKKYEKKNISSYVYKKHLIIKTFLNYLLTEFKEGSFVLDYFTDDLRPFYWHNFEKDKKIFSLEEVKYTSILNIKENKVISNFNLDIEDGEFIVLVGPSGCGKSTLLRMISGLEKIDHGEIFLDQKLINNLLPSKREIAMVFQSYALYPHMNVFENMSFGLKMEKIPKREINQKVNNAASTLQIEDLLERKPKQLSGGQRQRVAIGRAITRSPKVFLFDEPLSNLDASLRSEMRVEISKLHKKLNSNIIYVTHDQVEAMTLADRIVVLNKGNIEQYGTPSEIYSNPNNIFVAEFIGSPKMNIIKINKEQIVNSHKIELFKNMITFENFDFKDDIYLGIRPEDISIKNDHEIKLKVKVDLIENLGFEKIIYAKLFENQIVIKSSENIKNQQLDISFSKDKVLFFDKNKNRIR